MLSPKKRVENLTNALLKAVQKGWVAKDEWEAAQIILHGLVEAFLNRRQIPEMFLIQETFNSLLKQREQTSTRQQKHVAKEKKEEAKTSAFVKETAEIRRDLPADFDPIMLEKLGDSYVDVYANGSGFRARVVEPGPDRRRAHYLPTRKTAENAAMDRFRWYRQRDLPGTAWEKYVCSMTGGTTLSQGFTLDAQCIAWKTCAKLGTWPLMPERRPIDSDELLGEYNHDKAVLMKQVGSMDGDPEFEAAVARTKALLAAAKPAEEDYPPVTLSDPNGLTEEDIAMIDQVSRDFLAKHPQGRK